MKKQQAADAVLDMPGVIASYHLNALQNDYVLFGTNPMDRAEQSWFNSHAEELVDTLRARMIAAAEGERFEEAAQLREAMRTVQTLRDLAVGQTGGDEVGDLELARTQRGVAAMI